MKLRIALMTTALAGLTALAAFAADIDGKWTAETQGKSGAQTLTLKAEGSKLTGQMEGGRGGAVAISDGTVNGNNISFKVVREFNGYTVEQTFKGALAGSELKLSSGPLKRGGARELVFKKQ